MRLGGEGPGDEAILKLPYFLNYFPRVLLISDLTYPRVQYEGGSKTKVGSIS